MDTIVRAVYPQNPPRARKPATRKAKLTPTKRRHPFTSSVAAGIATVDLTLAGLSLTHLAQGIALVSGAPMWEGVALATGTDLGFISAEVAALVTNDSRIARWSHSVVCGTMLFSSAMNAFAFFHNAPSPTYGACAACMGAAIPALMYALTRIAAGLFTRT